MVNQDSTFREHSRWGRREFPSLRVQILHLRKRRYSRPSEVSPLLRPLLAIEALVTYGLLRTGINSRMVTLSWFLVGLLACGIIAWGQPWCFVLGACLLYIKTILDLADGVIGRFEKQFMSVKQDIQAYMKGIYLDRIQHAIESPFLGLALGWGVYRLTGNQWIIVCGLSVAVFRVFYRFDRILQHHVPDRFRERMCKLLDDGRVGRSGSAAQSGSSFVSRVFATLYFWAGGSNRRINSLILVFGLLDWLSVGMLETVWAMEGLMVALGILGPCAMIAKISSTQLGNSLWRRARQGGEAAGQPATDVTSTLVSSQSISTHDENCCVPGSPITSTNPA